MKKELPNGLPFKPGAPDVEILSDRWDGNRETIVYKWQGRTFEEHRVWSKPIPMCDELLGKSKALKENLGALKLDDEKITELHAALSDAKWRKLPPKLQGLPNIKAGEAWRLKARISTILGTRDPEIIKKVLQVDLGYPYPPFVDFVVRESLMAEMEAYQKEGL